MDPSSRRRRFRSFRVASLVSTFSHSPDSFIPYHTRGAPPPTQEDVNRRHGGAQLLQSPPGLHAPGRHPAGRGQARDHRLLALRREGALGAGPLPTPRQVCGGRAHAGLPRPIRGGYLQGQEEDRHAPPPPPRRHRPPRLDAHPAAPLPRVSAGDGPPLPPGARGGGASPPSACLGCPSCPHTPFGPPPPHPDSKHR